MSQRKIVQAVSMLSDRRGFLLSGASMAILPWMHQVTLGYVNRSYSFAKNPFQLGVASGDPDANSVILWTRLAMNPLEIDGGMPQENFEVTWELASDERCKSIVQSGTAVAKPEMGYSLHVEAKGLPSDHVFWYRFRCGDAESPIGWTRTMPAIDTMPTQLRFAFASCQHYETGLYTAYQHMSRDQLDLIVHLGDYIYEGAGQDKRLRKHVGSEIVSLDDYRTRYAQYKSDADLQAAHQSAPWIVTWDDHEVDNNYANLVSEEANVTPEAFQMRRAAAYQAYYENMPLRPSSIPQGCDMQLYRRANFGRLAQFEVLDTRQYRTDQPNGDGSKPLVDGALDPKGTLLGDKQERWLTEGLLQSNSIWNVLAQQVMMARADRSPGADRRFSMDQWSGYDVARTRLLKWIEDNQKKNTVVLTGDIHNNWANDLHVDFDNPRSQPVATEFVGTSISSGGNGVDKPKNLDSLLSENPFVRFHNAERGYVQCVVTDKEWRTNFQVVEYVDKPGAPKVTRASFVVERDRPKVQRA
jgi:alkaline phosphatase D